MKPEFIDKLNKLIEATSERAEDYEMVIKNLRRNSNPDLRTLYDKLSEGKSKYQEHIKK